VSAFDPAALSASLAPLRPYYSSRLNRVCERAVGAARELDRSALPNDGFHLSEIGAGLRAESNAQVGERTE